jgi:rSAM/selenodomain-associated transferase 2/rSAM/selenodomain-associated transferase 1
MNNQPMTVLAEYLRTLPAEPASIKESLAVFVRHPEPGRTKTRLIPTLGPEGAANLQRQMTRQTLATSDALAARRNVAVEVCYSGGDATLLGGQFGMRRTYRPQCDGDLGRRMDDSFGRAFSAGAGRVVLIGSDCPELTVEILAGAFEALRDHELVLGPAADGGYYLIGLRRCVPELFQGIDWSTPQVLAQTLRAARTAGLAPYLLPQLHDVDVPEDLPVWERACQPRETPWLSVIIPARNEAENLPKTLAALAGAAGVEIIVVDGGSTDGTAALARSLGARALETASGRARQMNTGAAVARGGALLFLHADTQLPPDFARHVQGALSTPGMSAGAFRLRTDSHRRLMRVVEFMVNTRSRLRQMPYGDQGIFLKAELFRELGGFPELPILEDYALVRRLRRRGTVLLAKASVITSSRRWAALGVWRHTLLNQAIVLAYRLGVSPQRLAKWRGG